VAGLVELLVADNTIHCLVVKIPTADAIKKCQFFASFLPIHGFACRFMDSHADSWIRIKHTKN